MRININLRILVIVCLLLAFLGAFMGFKPAGQVTCQAYRGAYPAAQDIIEHQREGWRVRSLEGTDGYWIVIYER